MLGITTGNVMFANSNAFFVTYGEVLPLAKSCLPIPSPGAHGCAYFSVRLFATHDALVTE
jgi:hypothetical protein